jgi:hypothetical protein
MGAAKALLLAISVTASAVAVASLLSFMMYSIKVYLI